MERRVYIYTNTRLVEKRGSRALIHTPQSDTRSGDALRPRERPRSSARTGRAPGLRRGHQQRARTMTLIADADVTARFRLRNFSNSRVYNLHACARPSPIISLRAHFRFSRLFRYILSFFFLKRALSLIGAAFQGYREFWRGFFLFRAHF